MLNVKEPSFFERLKGEHLALIARDLAKLHRKHGEFIHVLNYITLWKMRSALNDPRWVICAPKVVSGEIKNYLTLAVMHLYLETAKKDSSYPAFALQNIDKLRTWLERYGFENEEIHGNLIPDD
jgi:hypothetical protein